MNDLTAGDDYPVAVDVVTVPAIASGVEGDSA